MLKSRQIDAEVCRGAALAAIVERLLQPALPVKAAAALLLELEREFAAQFDRSFMIRSGRARM